MLLKVGDGRADGSLDGDSHRPARINYHIVQHRVGTPQYFRRTKYFAVQGLAKWELSLKANPCATIHGP